MICKMKMAHVIYSRMNIYSWLLVLICISAKGYGQSLPETQASVTREKNDVLNNGFLLERGLPPGYKKDGSVDYTSYVQSVLNKYDKVIFPSFKILINDTGLSFKNNHKIYFKKGSVLVLLHSDHPIYQILRIHDVSNVTLFNPVIEGDKYTHTGKTGEWGMGISIRGSSNIKIYNSLIEKCWGDGIYIGGTPKTFYANNVGLFNVICNDNRRNGISVISASNLIMQGPIVTNSSGTPPMGGIDMEANDKNDILDNVTILDAVTKNNQFGISIYVSPMNSTVPKQVNITVNHHTDDGSVQALQFGTKGDNLNGKVLISNAVWKNNKEVIKVVNYQPTGGIKVIFDGIKVSRDENNLPVEIQAKVFYDLKRNLKPGDTGVIVQ